MYTKKIVIAIGALAVLLASCLGNDAAANEPDVSPKSTSAPVAISWDDPTKATLLPDGWSIRKCEGEAPFMCVERDGSPVGALEIIAYPVSSFDALDPTGDPANNLSELAGGFHEALSSDRLATCGADYGFERLGPDEFALGEGPGTFYGFVGTLPDGSPSELNLQYATIVGDQIISITAIAYDEGGCPGRDDQSSWDSATLSEFRPVLEQALEDSPVPSI